MLLKQRFFHSCNIQIGFHVDQSSVKRKETSFNRKLFIEFDKIFQYKKKKKFHLSLDEHLRVI
jgi:hypothetical protein